MNRETRFLILLCEAILGITLWTLLGAVCTGPLRTVCSRYKVLRARIAADRELAAREKDIRKLDARLWNLLLATEPFGVPEEKLSAMPQRISAVASMAGVRLDRLVNGARETVYAGRNKKEVLGKRMAYYLRVRGSYADLLHFLDVQRREIPALLIRNMRILGNAGNPPGGKEVAADIEYVASIFSERLQAGEGGR